MPSRDFTNEDLFSSRMMSMHSSTHSSQIKTVGPAMSLRTSCWLLPQNEQYSVLFESPPPTLRRATSTRSERCGAAALLIRSHYRARPKKQYQIEPQGTQSLTDIETMTESRPCASCKHGAGPGSIGTTPNGSGQYRAGPAQNRARTL